MRETDNIVSASLEFDNADKTIDRDNSIILDNNDNYQEDKENEKCGIREVWASNMHTEFQAICRIVHDYPYVAMDTEFPGVVARPLGDFKSSTDYQYQLLRINVDLLKIIQLGLTFLDENGNVAPGTSTWQFNFKFDLEQDMYAEDSVSLLTNSGINFKKHEADGIDPDEFAAMLLVSGVVLMNDVKWVSFHSGYDFGYLLKILTCKKLPSEEKDFFGQLKLYFPCIYDVKYLMKFCHRLKGGLQEVADLLEVDRVGPQHQAGSDSLLTGKTFFKMTKLYFEDAIDDTKLHVGHLYGLGNNHSSNSSSSNGDSVWGDVSAPLSTSSSAELVVQDLQDLQQDLQPDTNFSSSPGFGDPEEGADELNVEANSSPEK